MKRTLACLLLLCLLTGAALSEATLEARLGSGGLSVRWEGCACPQATLTVYRDGWPVLVTDVAGTDGCFDAPVWYTQEPGDYAVQLRCAEGCVRVAAGEADPPPAGEAQEPTEVVTLPPVTPVPTPVATAIPTEVSTIPPTPAPTQEAGNALPSLAGEVVRQTNMERAARGLGALHVDAELERAAMVRAREIVESFSHTRPDGSDWSTVSSAASGENIAKGHDSADRVMAAWMSSDGHRDNILRAGYTRIGVCALEADGVLYWVQLFGA